MCWGLPLLCYTLVYVWVMKVIMLQKCISANRNFLKDRGEKGKKRKKKWRGEEGSVMGNWYIRFPHSNCITGTGGFMDILEKWSVIGILVLEVMDLPTTDFTVLQHTNVLGQCFDASICLYCMQHQCLSFALISCKAQRRKDRSPAYESLTETQLQHSQRHWVFQQWGDCSGQSRESRIQPGGIVHIFMGHTAA